MGYSIHAATPSTLADADSTRAFMANVYRWMFVGLTVSGLVAFQTAASSAAWRFAQRFYWPLCIVEVVMVFALARMAPRLSGFTAAVLYLAYAAVSGVTLSFIFMVYKLGTLANVFAVTAFAFLALSLYGTFTKRNLSAWASFLYFGLFGVLAAMVVGCFVHSSLLGFVTSCAGVVVFGGLTAYDTQKLRRYHLKSHGSAEGSLAIVGALTLYLDFINLFLELLSLGGND